MLKHGHIQNQNTQINWKKQKKKISKKLPLPLFSLSKNKKFFQKQNTVCNTSENSLFNGTSLDSVACMMPKSIKEQTDREVVTYLGNNYAKQGTLHNVTLHNVYTMSLPQSDTLNVYFIK